MTAPVHGRNLAHMTNPSDQANTTTDTTGSGPFADPQLAEFMHDLAGFPLLTASGDAAEMRRTTEERSLHRAPGPDMPARDIEIDGGLRTRLYRPRNAVDAIVIYFHGGGWTIGSLESHDRCCRLLADRAGVPVLAVDYRLAPEHPAPAGVDDAVTALEWVTGSPDELGTRPRVIALAGDSSGGTLAALATLRTMKRGTPPDLVALVYPTTDLSANGGSMITNAHGYGLDIADIEWFGRQWVPDRARWSDPDVSPLHAQNLAGFPQTIIVTCELDPLRDQGEAFGKRLFDAGVAVSLRREPGMVHNFLLWDLISPSCAAAIYRLADDLSQAITRLDSNTTPEDAPQRES